MEDYLNGRQPKWKTTNMEDDLNGRQPRDERILKKLSEWIFECIRNTEPSRTNILWFISQIFEYLVMTILPAKIVHIETLGISVQIGMMMMKKSLTMMTVRQSFMLIMKIQTQNLKEDDIFVIYMWNNTFFYQFSFLNYAVPFFNESKNTFKYIHSFERILRIYS